MTTTAKMADLEKYACRCPNPFCNSPFSEVTFWEEHWLYPNVHSRCWISRAPIWYRQIMKSRGYWTDEDERKLNELFREGILKDWMMH